MPSASSVQPLVPGRSAVAPLVIGDTTSCRRPAAGGHRCPLVDVGRDAVRQEHDHRPPDGAGRDDVQAAAPSRVVIVGSSPTSAWVRPPSGRRCPPSGQRPGTPRPASPPRRRRSRRPRPPRRGPRLPSTCADPSAAAVPPVVADGAGQGAWCRRPARRSCRDPPGRRRTNSPQHGRRIRGGRDGGRDHDPDVHPLRPGGLLRPLTALSGLVLNPALLAAGLRDRSGVEAPGVAVGHDVTGGRPGEVGADDEGRRRP